MDCGYEGEYGLRYRDGTIYFNQRDAGSDGVDAKFAERDGFGDGGCGEPV